MTKDQFLNSWSKELATESTMSTIDAKKFLNTFYDKVIGFEQPRPTPEISEEGIADIIYEEWFKTKSRTFKDVAETINGIALRSAKAIFKEFNKQ